MTLSHVGKTIEISPTVPATSEPEAYALLDWTKVAGFSGGLRLGFAASNVDVPDLEGGITLGAKGMRTGENSTLAFRRVDSDTGQALIKQEARSNAQFGSVKLISADGDRVKYAQGYFHSYAEAEIGGDGHEGFTVQFKQRLDHELRERGLDWLFDGARDGSLTDWSQHNGDA